ncbi:MAG: response regulator [Lachnospiraceae bacterium]|nr:response regulator [Lachnospiraceae bacterium]
MQKVLIVDDEPIARNSVKYIIEKHVPELEIVALSSSGKDAIAKNYEFRPDIIIMDINMPGINGIEAMKQIRLTNKDVAFIIVSAYDYFEYAKEAVMLNASEYILKPVRKEALIESLKRVMLKIEQRQLDMLHQLEQNEKMRMVMPILENGFINAICLHDTREEELQEYCRLFDYKEATGFVVVIEFMGMNSLEDIVKSSKVYNTYRDVLKGICSCIVGPIMSNRVVLYINMYCSEDEYEQKSRAIDVAEKIIKRTGHIFKDICIGIGNYYTDLTDAKKSYREAVKALRYMNKDSINEEVSSRIFHISDDINKVELGNDTYENLYEVYVFDKMKKDDLLGAREGFEEIFERMVQDSTMDYLAVKNAMLGFIVGLSKRWYSYTGDYYSVMSAILNAEGKEDLFACANSYLNEIIMKISNDNQNKEKNIVKIAEDFIADNYADDITLEDVSREVNLSANYFSRIFKECTGVNFSDRLLSYRMEKAKQILRETNYSIKDVSFMVGYLDPNYFTKLFKKYTGITSREYRKKIEERNSVMV